MKRNLVLLFILMAVASKAQATPLWSIHNLQNWKPVKKDSLAMTKRLAAPVAYIDGTYYSCSGFLVGEDLLMTNHHCIDSVHDQAEEDDPINGDPVFLNLLPEDFSKVYFDRQIDIKAKDRVGHKILKILAYDEDLDFMLLKIERPKGIAPLTLSFKKPVKDQRLVSVSHPGDGPFPSMKVIDKSVNCKVSKTYSWSKKLYHQCDTLGGSSGSPIIDYQTLTVVGLHNLGGAYRAYERYFEMTEKAEEELTDSDYFAFFSLVENEDTLGIFRIRNAMIKKQVYEHLSTSYYDEEADEFKYSIFVDAEGVLHASGKTFKFRDIFKPKVRTPKDVAESSNSGVQMPAILNYLQENELELYLKLNVKRKLY